MAGKNKSLHFVFKEGQKEVMRLKVGKKGVTFPRLLKRLLKEAGVKNGKKN